jgi:hypothetical protein
MIFRKISSLSVCLALCFTQIPVAFAETADAPAASSGIATDSVASVDISTATISSIPNQTYSGSALTPALTISYAGTPLVQNTDYTLAYSGNTDAGTANVTITGIGSYTGTATATFTIDAADLSSATFSWIKRQLYGGYGATASTWVYVNSALLFSNSDYTTSYSNNTSRGTATLTITGEGNYTGTASTTFNVIQFDDLDYTMWYGQWIPYVVSNELMSGYTGNYDFGPLDSITRGQAAVILYRYACAEDDTLSSVWGSSIDASNYATSTTFADESSSKYYTAAINWARSIGVMTGDTATGYTTVRAEDAVTREELATMIYRYVSVVSPYSASKEGKTDYSSIQGMDEVSDWALTAVKWCASRGIIDGLDIDGVYYMNPTDSLWRASMAKATEKTVLYVLDWGGLKEEPSL